MLQNMSRITCSNSFRSGVFEENYQKSTQNYKNLNQICVKAENIECEAFWLNLKNMINSQRI